MNITDGLVVYPGVIKKHIREELPFMATETILMNAVKRGGDRQELHEVIRVCSMKAAENVKKYGKENNLIELIAQENIFDMTLEELNDILDPSKFTGLSSEQTVEFINEVIKPRLSMYTLENNIVEIKE